MLLTRTPERARAAATGGPSTLFTDIVGSTGHAVALGDAAWAALLERHHAAVRAELARHGGEEMDEACTS